MGKQWEKVRELNEGEFRIREEDGKCILERRAIMPINVTEECDVELYHGDLTPPKAAKFPR